MRTFNALHILVVILFPSASFATPNVAVLYTKSDNSLEEFENMTEVVKFAFDEYNKINHQDLHFNILEVDDKGNPDIAQARLQEVFKKSPPEVIIGPTYSNVGLALKPFINEKQVPMISIFATHNDLTKNAPTMFQMCASNNRLIKTLVDFLEPQIKKNKLDVTVFKDLSDFYSTDLADSFRRYMSAVKSNINEVLFRGASGLERLKDVNSKVWSPSKKEILFLATQDIVAGRILTSMETSPWAVAAIDPVNFVEIIQKIKKAKMHLRMIYTSQWIPGKSEFSKKVEADFKDHLNRKMTIPSALAFDSAYAFASAYDRAKTKRISVTEALKDGTKVIGITGNLALGRDGERITAGAFVKEDILQ